MNTLQIDEKQAKALYEDASPELKEILEKHFRPARCFPCIICPPTPKFTK